MYFVSAISWSLFIFLSFQYVKVEAIIQVKVNVEDTEVNTVNRIKRPQKPQKTDYVIKTP